MARHLLLTGGSANSDNIVTYKNENEYRIMQPVVSQTCASQPSINQMLVPDKDCVQGKQPKIWPADNLHFFDNTEIVGKLCGPGITFGSLEQWRNVEQQWQQMYSPAALEPRSVKFNDEGKQFRKIKIDFK